MRNGLLGDLKPLRAPYDEGEFTQDAAYHIARRWGFRVDDLQDLEKAIDSDLDEDRYGIGWWDHLPAWQRIVISDQLVEAVGDVCANLIEAKVHYSSWQDVREQARDAIRYRPGPGARITPRASDSPLGDLGSAQLDAHMTGFFRAVGSVLDCLGATIIGVGALPAGLRKSDWKTALRALPQRPDAEAALNVDQIVSQAGPSDWDDWTIGMRNMRVHRPRRRHFTYIRPIYETGPKTVEYLPKAPLRSEVEGMVGVSHAQDQLIHEDAADTIGGILQSTLQVVGELSSRLLRLWHTRRVSPDWLPQPTEQWPSWDPPDLPHFDGYTRRGPSLANRPGIEIMISAKAGRRLRASAMLDDRRRLWREWLGDELYRR